MFNKMLQLFSIFLIFGISSCKTLNNNIDDLVLICKQDAKSDEVFLYATYEDSIITQGVQFQLFNHEGRHDLPVTRGGCASVKKGDGFVKVIAGEHFGLLSLKDIANTQKAINIPTNIADREIFLKCGTLIDSSKLKNITMLKLTVATQITPNPVEYGWRFLAGKTDSLESGESECKAVPINSEGYFIYKALTGYFLQSFNSNLLESVTTIAYSETQESFCTLPDVKIFLSESSASLTICDKNISPTFLDYCESKSFENDPKRKLVKAVIDDLKLSHCPSPDEQTTFKQLSLQRLKIDDLNLLSGFTGLTNLNATRIGLKNIDAIVRMKNLVELKFGSNQLDFLPSLKELTKLRYLDLSNNKLTSVEGLKLLKSLVKLDISENKISDLSSLSSSLYLEDLRMKNNKVSNIGFVSNHPQLNYLWLSYNQIVDLSPLRSLTNLQSLFIDGNKGIKDYATLSVLPLQLLNATDLPIKEFGFLNGLLDLSILDVSGSCGDLSTLPALPSLKWFIARDCQFANLEPLRQMHRITQIDFQNNAITDLSPIKDLKLLDTLLLSGNPIEVAKTPANCPKNAQSLALRKFCEDSN